MDTELKYKIQLPITKIGHPTPNGLLLEPESYKNAITEYIENVVNVGKAILTNSEVTVMPDGRIVQFEYGNLGDITGKVKSIDIDNGIATILVREEFKNLSGDEYRLMAALLGERDNHLFVVKRILQYFIVPKLKYTDWGF